MSLGNPFQNASLVSRSPVEIAQDAKGQQIEFIRQGLLRAVSIFTPFYEGRNDTGQDNLDEADLLLIGKSISLRNDKDGEYARFVVLTDYTNIEKEKGKTETMERKFAGMVLGKEDNLHLLLLIQDDQGRRSFELHPITRKPVIQDISGEKILTGYEIYMYDTVLNGSGPNGNGFKGEVYEFKVSYILDQNCPLGHYDYFHAKTLFGVLGL